MNEGINIEYDGKIYKIVFSKYEEQDGSVYAVFNPKNKRIWVERLSCGEENFCCSIYQQQKLVYTKIKSCVGLMEFIYKNKPQQIEENDFITYCCDGIDFNGKITKSVNNPELNNLSGPDMDFETFCKQHPFKKIGEYQCIDGNHVMQLIKKYNKKLYFLMKNGSKDTSNKQIGVLDCSKFFKFLRNHWY